MTSSLPPLPDPATLPRIRTSDRIAFRRCRRMWNWQSALRRNLEAKDRPIYFLTGTGVHFALEDYHGYNRYGHPADAFLAFSHAHKLGKLELPAGWDTEVEMVLGMMDHYVDWLEWGRDPLQTYYVDGVPQVEVSFEIDLHHIRWGPAIYQGTFDRVAIDEDGFLWIVEYKTALNFEVRHLETDPQVSAYAWAARQLYERPVSGTIYQQHRKKVPQMPRLLSTGKFSADKNQNTTAAKYAEALENLYGDVHKAPTQNLRCLDELLSREAEKGDHYIRREQVYRSETQITNEHMKIMAELGDILNPHLELYPNPTRDCAWQCSMWAACVMQDEGADYEGEIALTTQSRNQQEGQNSWRSHLPDPTTLRELPQSKEVRG